jgi:hypothetical protein
LGTVFLYRFLATAGSTLSVTGLRTPELGPYPPRIITSDKKMGTELPVTPYLKGELLREMKEIRLVWGPCSRSSPIVANKPFFRMLSVINGGSIENKLFGVKNASTTRIIQSNKIPRRIPPLFFN